MLKTDLHLNGIATGIPVEMARTPFTRMRGLMGRRNCEGGMLLDPCRGIHTFFMRFRIDAVFLDDANRVIRIIPDIRPWRMPLPVPSARRVLEMPAGAAGKLRLRPGDALSFAG